MIFHNGRRIKIAHRFLNFFNNSFWNLNVAQFNRNYNFTVRHAARTCTDSLTCIGVKNKEKNFDIFHLKLLQWPSQLYALFLSCTSTLSVHFKRWSSLYMKWWHTHGSQSVTTYQMIMSTCVLSFQIHVSNYR